MVTPLSNTSFTVTWTISDHNYSYTVIWTNLNTGVMNSFTVPENTNSYNVTGLSDHDNYNVSVAIVGVCGMITSDPIIVYGKSIYTYNNLILISISATMEVYTYVCMCCFHMYMMFMFPKYAKHVCT